MEPAKFLTLLMLRSNAYLDTSAWGERAGGSVVRFMH